MSTLLFAGGGTGGHVYPLIAVADAVRALSPELRLVFVGTERGMETRVVPERGYELELMGVLPIRGGGLGGALRGIWRAAGSLPAGRALVSKYAPAALLSIGGYAAGPLSLAARFAGIPVALIEPNSVIGLANRLIAPFVQRAYTAFAESERHFTPNVVRRAGVPIRAGFDARDYAPSSERPRVLVIGGSLGAKALNEAVPQAIARLSAAPVVVHQCGRAHEAAARALYAELRLEAEVVPFIDDMPAALASADLVIGRAGASAVSEICAVGRPSLLIPYPFAAGDHQQVNARALQRAGAAVCVASADATAERLCQELERLLPDAALRAQMAGAARALGRPMAARTIALDLLALASLSSTVQDGGRAAGANDSSHAARFTTLRSTRRGVVSDGVLAEGV
ncbi:MAG TPA: undecaprenyldiphospho-muramoylpentapeptide beta-N-acetylglucosaminyltransferase [Polyangiaceae bacterium]|jgi:UDP-N-acetylglucosamine--N-acetylmuramyl-(pentapeptide) pyrophosphoryl-undecaprenol N-acetylglucosamine transferase